MHKRSLLLFFLALLATGCAITPASTEQKTVVSPPPLQYQERALADLLVAEVALQRDQYNLGLDYYEHHATRSTSPLLAEQTALLALHLQDANKALEHAERWLQLAPNNDSAHEVAALALILLERPNEAAQHVSQLLKHDEESGLNNLIAHSQGLNEKGSILLLSSLSQLAEQHPKQGALWYARAMYLQQQEEPKAALRALNKALHITPKHSEAKLLKGQLLFETGREQASFRHMRKLISHSNGALRPQALYIRLLLTANEDKKAIKELAELAQQHPEEQDLRFSMALFGIERGANQAAVYALKTLLKEGYRQNDMRLYLAMASEQEGDYEQALTYYEAMPTESADVQTQFQKARLYHLQKNYEQSKATLKDLHRQFPDQAVTLYMAEAELWFNDDLHQARSITAQALEEHPQNHDLLYYSAMLAEQDNDISASEAQLQRILADNPRHANALNALGYILTNHTNRYTEANRYITQALLQDPTNPAFLDSKGWVLFHLGDYQGALRYLEEAYAALADDEVAQHLMHTLEALGRHKEAKALQKQHPTLTP